MNLINKYLYKKELDKPVKPNKKKMLKKVRLKAVKDAKKIIT